jgi:hypothetical protein
MPHRDTEFTEEVKKAGRTRRRRGAQEVREARLPWRRRERVPERSSAFILSLPNPLHRQEDFAQRHSDHRGKRRGWSHAGERRERGSTG